MEQENPQNNQQPSPVEKNQKQASQNQEIKTTNPQEPQKEESSATTDTPKSYAEIFETVEKKVLSLTQKYAEKFNADAFRSAAWAAKGAVDTLNVEDFLKKDEDQGCQDCKDCRFSNARGKFFDLEEKDGKIVAHGNNGEVIEGKNFEEVNDNVCSIMKQASLAENREPQVSFHSSNDEQRKIFSRNAVIKHGIVIGNDGYSQDKQFWQDLKKQYLEDGKGDLSEWERMTRNVPDDIMQRSPEERTRNQKLLDEAKVRDLRGLPYNPKKRQSDKANMQIGEKSNVDKDFVNSLRNGENPNESSKNDKSKVAQVAGAIAKNVVADIAVKAAAKAITGL